MGVMTSPALDNVPLDLKATAAPLADTMAVDTEVNGVQEATLNTEIPPSVNGNGHLSPEVAPALEPTTNVISGIDSVAQFLPDSQADNNSLFGDSEMPSVTDAVEAPTSDVRDEAGPDTSAATQPSGESTQQVPETQLAASEEPSGGPVQSNNPDSYPDPDSTAASIDSAAPPTKQVHDLKIETQQSASQAPLTGSPTTLDHEMEDAPTSGKVRPREDDVDMEDAPDAKRTKTQEEGNESAEFKVPDLPTHTEQLNGTAAPPGGPAPPAQESSSVQQAVPYKTWPSAPMTEAQRKFLLERIRNTKKIKVSNAFKAPVDWNLLNIPTYPTIVTNPMDLGTMETKLKTGTYTYVADFMADLDQIVTNSELFNQTTHPVTHDAYNMRAYFLKGTDRLPKEGDEAARPFKPAKKPSTSSAAPKARRESRVAIPVAKSPPASTPTAASPATPAWPLNADGLPLIRRDSSSTNDRPKREIHRPPSKDLPYSAAKPRKKKYQLELKFCENVLTELQKPKYAKFSWPFMAPVDPVALNIPSYFKIIKKPMDFGTVKKNLDSGIYQNAKDFYADAQLVFTNCFKFNPETDDVHKMGKQLSETFNSLWSEKADWLAQHAPENDAQSAGSGYSDDEDEEEEEEDPAHAQFLAIQKQIAALNETAQQLLQQQQRKGTSPKAPGKKKKSSSSSKRKAGPLTVPPPATKKTKQPVKKSPAPLSYAQKQEISEGISTLGDADMRRAVQIIRNGCPHLANTNDDEMELDMDEINDETLRELFRFIKQVRGPRAAAVDDDYEVPRPAAPSRQNTSRTKKNKPMGKLEQEESLRRIHEKMQSFNGAVSGSSQSPPANQEESSDDDDDDSASESEEE